ncbi:MAG: asparagine synthase-related protein [Pseudomonadota bacterium]
MSAIIGRIELDKRSPDERLFADVLSSNPIRNQDQRRVQTSAHSMIACASSQFTAATDRASLFVDAQGICTVADAVLFNRAELAEKLGVSTDNLDAISNAELIHRSFGRWGDKVFEQLQGDYAFAIFDESQNDLFLARDHIGSRPLLWAQIQDTIVFGSFVEPIVAFADLDWKIDESVVAEYMACRIIPLSKSFFQHLYYVPAGSYLRRKSHTVRVRRWWQPTTKPSKETSDAALIVAECTRLITQSVTNRMRDNGVIGCHFSGGVDSSIVTKIAAQQLRAQDRSLTAAYTWAPAVSDRYPEVPAKDERIFLRRIAENENFELRFGDRKAQNLLRFIERPIEFEGQPDLSDELHTLKLAEQDMIEVMLSGWGADEVFSAHGVGYASRLIARGKLRSAHRWIARNYGSLRNPKTLVSAIWSELIFPVLPKALYSRLHPLRFSRIEDNFPSASLKDKYSRLFRTRMPIVKFGPDPNENLIRHLTFGHTTARMESWATRSAPHGFEYRYPLTDKALLEYLLVLPPEFIFMNNQPRGLAKAISSDLLSYNPSKTDPINEKYRTDAWADAWQTIAQSVDDGAYDDECPWVDKRRFIDAAKQPLDQSDPKNITKFMGLVAAARVWALYRRATSKGWI